ncbi:hypothetical protein GCM10027051_07670 [Niabella terrae]
MIALVLLLPIAAVLLAMRGQKQQQANFEKDTIVGAWTAEWGGQQFVLLFQDGYCMFTQFKGRQFVASSGGPYTVGDDSITITTQFNSANKSDMGQSHSYGYKLSGDALTTLVEGYEMKWTRADAGSDKLAGNWRITQRKQGDQMVDMPLRARRTLKLLTATRFQWAAINIETGEFSGTGGGTYSFENGKYTEHIEFFSRDSSRVGMSLTFDGKLENGKWIHSGKSSKGAPIYEVWSRMEK